MFVLCSDITIGKFRFSGVHEVRVQRSLHSFCDMAWIKIPSICRVIRGKSASPVTLVTGNQFADGDKVTINLGYNDTTILSGAATPIIPGGKNDGLCTVFQGFVKRRNMNMPLEVECEGYSYKLRRMNVTAFRAKTTVSELLKLLMHDQDSSSGKIVQGEANGISVVVKNDLHLINVSLNENNGIEIIEAIKRWSQGTLNIFFINPTTLWCGLTYTPYTHGMDPFGLGTVKYKLGYNVVKDNNLKERVLADDRVQILFGGTFANGKKVMTASDEKSAKRRQKTVLNNTGDLADMQMMANEAQYKANYAGYEGSINAFLQPYCGPGWIADISDDRYEERNGQYMIEGTDITYGQRGARIKVEIGPLLGFNPNK
jgi:hypothetical protein